MRNLDDDTSASTGSDTFASSSSSNLNEDELRRILRTITLKEEENRELRGEIGRLRDEKDSLRILSSRDSSSSAPSPFRSIFSVLITILAIVAVGVTIGSIKATNILQNVSSIATRFDMLAAEIPNAISSGKTLLASDISRVVVQDIKREIGDDELLSMRRTLAMKEEEMKELRSENQKLRNEIELLHSTSSRNSSSSEHGNLTSSSPSSPDMDQLDNNPFCLADIKNKIIMMVDSLTATDRGVAASLQDLTKAIDSVKVDISHIHDISTSKMQEIQQEMRDTSMAAAVLKGSSSTKHDTSNVETEITGKTSEDSPTKAGLPPPFQTMFFFSIPILAIVVLRLVTGTSNSNHAEAEKVDLILSCVADIKNKVDMANSRTSADKNDATSSLEDIANAVERIEMNFSSVSDISSKIREIQQDVREKSVATAAALSSSIRNIWSDMANNHANIKDVTSAGIRELAAGLGDINAIATTTLQKVSSIEMRLDVPTTELAEAISSVKTDTSCISRISSDIQDIKRDTSPSSALASSIDVIRSEMDTMQATIMGDLGPRLDNIHSAMTTALCQVSNMNDETSTAMRELIAATEEIKTGLRGVEERFSNDVPINASLSPSPCRPSTMLGVPPLVSGGCQHSLALLKNGTVTAWGHNGYSQTSVPAGLSNVKAISAGNWFSMALKKGGTVVCWGRNDYGQTSMPANLVSVKAISAGWAHALALFANGKVAAWGSNNHGQTSVPSGLDKVKAIAAGYYHSLALLENGTVIGWGWNNRGQVTIPVNLENVMAIAAGWEHSLALKNDGTVVAWGDATNTIPAGLGSVKAIAAGSYHSLALLESGKVVAWGSNDYGQTAVPDELENVKLIAAGQYHSLAVKEDDSVVGWGWNNKNQVTIPEALE